MIKSSALGKQHQLWRAPGPQREGLQTQLCPGLLIRPCSLLEVPVRLQIFSTSANAEKKQTHRSDTTDTQTTPARCREHAREVRGQRDFEDRHAWHHVSASNTQYNTGNILYTNGSYCKLLVSLLWKANMTFSMFKSYNLQFKLYNRSPLKLLHMMNCGIHLVACSEWLGVLIPFK